jgi:hypothetical protein
MRLLLIAPIALVVTALAGFGICKAAQVDPHVRSILLAGAVAIVACAAAATPVLLARRASQAGMAQAGLLATTAHLFTAAALSFVALTVLHAGVAFVYWILAFYWATLTGVVIASVRAVNRAPVGPAIAPGPSDTPDSHPVGTQA